MTQPIETPSSTLPLPGRGMSLSDIVTRQARLRSDAEAFVDSHTRRTYRELDQRVTRLANALTVRGIGDGDRVGLLALNSMAVIETWLATLRLGAIVVPVNFRFVAGEVAYVLDDSGTRIVVADLDLAPKLDADRRSDAIIIGEDYEEAIALAPDTPIEREVPDEHPAYIMYTSGTTGSPKGAVLTHRNLLLHGLSSILTHGGTHGYDVWMSAAPMFHIAGLSGLVPVLINGGKTVIPPSGGFDPAATVRTLAAEQVTSCFMVPAQWDAVCALPDLDSYDLSHLRRLTWGAAPAPVSLLRTMIETFPHAEICSAFGQTECSPVTTLLRGHDAIRKIGSVGTPIANVEVRVVDDDMNDVPRGEVGEIVYRSPMVMKEYWNKPDETAHAFRGGWFHSGDLVRQDDEGYVYVVDRKKDMIISGGENIYCAEVEGVLSEHPKIAEVALIGVPDEKWGETPMAVVVPHDSATPPLKSEIEDFSLRRLAAYKRPRQLVTVNALPRNASGKVIKSHLREKFGHTLANPPDES